MIIHITQTITTTATSLFEIDADSAEDALARFNSMTHEQREDRQIDYHETEDVQTTSCSPD